MSIRGATLSIELSLSDNHSVICFKHSTNNLLEINGDLNKSKLAEQRKALRKDLLQFESALGLDLNITNWTRLSSAMNRLYRRGQILAWQLFDENPDNCRKVSDLCRKAIPTWKSSNPFSSLAIDHPKIVQVEASLEDMIPIEFLPLFDAPASIPKVQDYGSLIKVLRLFLGFSATVIRNVRRISPTLGTKLENHPKLPIKFFQYANLAGAQQEAKFFQDISQTVELEGPWPQEILDPIQTAQALAEHLYNPTLRFNGLARDSIDQIQHFACHCDTTNAISERHYLLIGNETGQKCKVSIGDLQAKLFALSIASSRSTDAALPLVFLNACGSSVIDPTRIASFLRLILKNGNRGFIGTETVIPDDFAAAFSAQFYRELLKGKTVGDAMHLAKWKMVERHKNPLGILYTLYADPDMKIRMAPERTRAY